MRQGSFNSGAGAVGAGAGRFNRGNTGLSNVSGNNMSGLLGSQNGNDPDAELKRLQREFMEIDKDGSGKIDKDEMNVFLMEKGIDEEHRHQIIDVVFNNCDVDGNNQIELDEFVQHYLNTKNMLVERENDLLKQIADSYKLVQESKTNLNLAYRAQPQTMAGLVGILTITVISAQNLTGVNTSHVVMVQGNQRGESQTATGVSPSFNRNTIKFNVQDDNLPLLVQIIDVQRGVSVMDTEIPLDRIGSEQYPEDREIVVTTPIGEKDPTAPRLLVTLNYQLNNVFRLKRNIDEAENQIREDV